MTMVIPQLLAPLFARYPQLGGPITGNLIVNLFVILPVVFYIMPWVTRRCASWLRGWALHHSLVTFQEIPI